MSKMNLTPEQWEKVRPMAKQGLDKMADLSAKSMKAQIEIAGLRWDKEMDAQKVKKLFAEEAEVQAEMFLTGMNYLRGLKNVLTPEQAQQLEGFEAQ